MSKHPLPLIHCARHPPPPDVFVGCERNKPDIARIDMVVAQSLFASDIMTNETCEAAQMWLSYGFKLLGWNEFGSMCAESDENCAIQARGDNIVKIIIKFREQTTVR